jgi:hypothetical protein
MRLPLPDLDFTTQVMAPYIKLLYEALHKLPNKEHAVWRGVNTDLYSKYIRTKGVHLYEETFTSTTMDMDTMGSFMGAYGARTMINFHSLTGKDISDYSQFPGEDEVMVLPWTKFTPTNVFRIPGSTLVMVELKESPIAPVPVLLTSPQPPTAAPTNVGDTHMPTAAPTMSQYILATIGTCSSPSTFIDTAAACETAALILSLADTAASSASASTNPYGCYYKHSNAADSRLWFNPNGDMTDDDTARVSLCQFPTTAPTVAPTAAPTAAPTNVGDTHVPTASPTVAPTAAPTALPVTKTTVNAEACLRAAGLYIGVKAAAIAFFSILMFFCWGKITFFSICMFLCSRMYIGVKAAARMPMFRACCIPDEKSELQQSTRGWMANDLHTQP